MQHAVIKVKVVFRRWDRSGLVETSRTFDSLEDLYAYCVSATHPGLMDRLSIEGVDQNGRPRQLNFGFLSITSTEGDG